METTTSSAYADLLWQLGPVVVMVIVALALFGWVATVLFSARAAVHDNQPSLLYQQAAADAAAVSKDAVVKAAAPVRGLERTLFDAGIDIPASTWRFGCIACAVAAAVLGLLVGGIAPALALLAVAAIAPQVYVSQKKGKQLRRLEEQLAQAELQIAESSRSGLPVEKAILSTVLSSDDPLKGQFERVYNEITYGGSNLTDSLDRFAKRTSNKDADLLAAVVAVQQESGSSLSAALEFLSETVQRRIEMRQTLRAKIAEMKVTILVAGGMPFVLFAICCFSIRGFWQFYCTQPAGWILVAASLLMEAVGLLILYRMSDIKMD